MAFDVGSIIGHAKLDTKGWTSGASILQKSFKGIQTGIKVLGAAVVAGMALSVKAANDFQKEFSNVRTLLDETTVNTKAMKQELLGLDARLGSSKELAKGLYQTLSAGVDAADAVRFVGEAAKFAKAGLTDTYTSVDALTTILNAYRMNADQATKVSDVLFQTIKLGKTTGQQLASSLGDVIPSASQLGVSIEELGASMVTMTKQGINTANATTQLNAIFTAFLKPSTEMSEALEEVGYASGSALIEAEGLTGALEFLQNATQGNKDKLAALLPNVRAFKGALALTGSQADVYTEALKEMGEASGSTDEAFQKQELTFETLGNSLNKIAIRIGDALLPTIYDLATQFTTFINSTQGMDKISTAVAGIAAGFAIFKDIIDALISPLRDTFIGIVDSLKEAFSRLSGKSEESVTAFDVLAGIIKVLGIGLRVVGKVIELIIIGLADFIVAITESGKTIGSFFQFLAGKKSWEEVKANASNAGKAFKTLTKNIGDNFNEIVNTVTDEFNKLPKEVESLSGKMTTSWDKVFKKTKNSVLGNLGDIENGIKQKLQTVGDGLQELLKVAQTTSNTLAIEIYNSLEKGGEGLDEFMKKAKETNNELAIQMGEMVKTMLEAGDSIKGKWRKTMDDFASKLEEGVGKATKIAGYFVNQIGSAFNSISSIVSMSMDNQLQAIQIEGQQELETLEEDKQDAIEKENEKYQGIMEALQQKIDLGAVTEEEGRALKEEAETEHNARLEEIETTHDTKIDEQKEKQRKKENAQKKKMFETQKAFDIANVWIQAASGIIAAWAGSFQALGWIPIVGPALAIAMAGVMSGLIIGTAIAQTVMISQQQFVPAAARGGTITQSGMIMTDEEGGEIKRYNTGDVIIPNDISKQIANNTKAGKGDTNIYMAGAFSGANISNKMDFEYMLNKIINELSKRLALRT